MITRTWVRSGGKLLIMIVIPVMIVVGCHISDLSFRLRGGDVGTTNGALVLPPL